MTKKEKELLIAGKLIHFMTKRLGLSVIFYCDRIMAETERGMERTNRFEWKVNVSDPENFENVPDMETKSESMVKSLLKVFPMIKIHFKKNITHLNSISEFECAAWCKRAMVAIDKFK